MRDWYYAEDGEQAGPVAEADLARLIDAGHVARDTFVWTEEYEDWVPAHDVPELMSPPEPVKITAPPPASRRRPEPPPPEPDRDEADREQPAPEREQPHPWLRYWAKMVDIMVVSVLARIVIGITLPGVAKAPDRVLGILFLLGHVFAEPFALSNWGTTPGRALLGISLRNHNDSRLSYHEALGRAFKVWFRGLGLGIPVVSFITQIHAYDRLTRYGITSWDEEGPFVVSHETIEPWRVFVAVAIVVVLTSLSAAVLIA